MLITQPVKAVRWRAERMSEAARAIAVEAPAVTMRDSMDAVYWR